MKKLFVILMAVASMASCQTKNTYTISGTVEGAKDGDTIQLAMPEGRQLVPFATAVVTNGSYSFEGTSDEVNTAYITVSGRPVAQLYLEPGDIKADIPQNGDCMAVGTKNNNLQEAFYSDLKALQEKYTALAEQMQNPDITDEQADDIKSRMGEVENDYETICKSAVTDNIDTEFGRDMFLQSYHNFEAEEIVPIIDNLIAKYPDNEQLQSIKEVNDVTLGTAVGKPFKDFAMPSLDGTEVKLSDFVSKNKYTLVDFWASWCGPCRGEMPEVKAAYAAYKDKGFGIVGVSLDRDEQSWKNCVAEMGLEWDHMSDLKYWDCEGAALYGVRAIPATVLIAQDGTIVARNLRGAAIAEKLAELLK